jgi:hypothetical protein
VGREGIRPYFGESGDKWTHLGAYPTLAPLSVPLVRKNANYWFTCFSPALGVVFGLRFAPDELNVCGSTNLSPDPHSLQFLQMPSGVSSKLLLPHAQHSSIPGLGFGL